MRLCELLKGVDVVSIINDRDIEIANVDEDSRRVKENTLFICIKGAINDGHDFIPDVIEKGATAIVVNEDYDESQIKDDVVIIKVKDTVIALAKISCTYFDNPTHKFKLIGVTGTKGKTTTTYMIKSILEKAGKKVGLIGTICNMIGDKKYASINTTPTAFQLQALFYKMAQEKVDVVVMEVSSHALAMNRVIGCDFDIGIFTNLSQDHMDFHKTFENYIEAKSILFKMCKYGFVNCDDIYSLTIEKNATCPISTFGIDNGPKIAAKDIIITNSYAEFKLMVNNRPQKIKVGILGRFTVYNALAAISAVSLLNIDFLYIKEGLENVTVPGRAELVPNMHGLNIMIDYAHSPASLESILKAVKPYTKGEVICVFGCGGDRDKTKRPIMGKIAGENANFTVITSDNPRTENAKDIVDQIEEGIKETKGKYKVIVNRISAIEFAIKRAKKNDLIILAGKGHETYQIVGTEKKHFDEREIVANILKKLPLSDDIL